MSLPDPAQALAQRRQDFEDALTALEIPETHRLSLRAAAGALAKAHTVDALRTFAHTRRVDPETVGPN